MRMQSFEVAGVFLLAVLAATPTVVGAQRRAAGPTGVAAGTAAAATLTWNSVEGALSYSVRRWKQDDPRCCNNSVAALDAKTATWTDGGPRNEGFPLAGVYVFEVTAVLANGTSGATVVNWQRPDAVPIVSRGNPEPLKGVGTLPELPAPVGVSARNDPAGLVLTWNPVPGATGYQIDAAPTGNGPWTSLLSAPIAATQFVHVPTGGWTANSRGLLATTVAYYRVSAARAFVVSGTASIVPFIYHPPINPLGVSASQSGASLIVSWNPVAGAIGYTVWATATRNAPLVQLQVGGQATSATFVALIPSGLAPSNYRAATFGVSAKFPPQGAPGVDALRSGQAVPVYDPALCWPPGGEQPSASAQPVSAPVQNELGVTLSWPFIGQVIAYRVARAAVGSAQWESIACLTPGVDGAGIVRFGGQYGESGGLSPTTTTLTDQSVALRASSYQYRVTAIGVTGPDGKRSTSDGIVTVPLFAPAPIPVGITTSAAGANPKWVRLAWPVATPLPNAMVTSSYGYFAFIRPEDKDPPGTHVVNGALPGTHTFTLTPVSSSGVPGLATNVTVVVP